MYQPTKYFAGKEFYTLYFNIAVIWFMTGLFFVTLYFDLLKRLIKRLETSRKYRVKDK
jgi:ABC transport system ATP-binding/permease protein